MELTKRTEQDVNILDFDGDLDISSGDSVKKVIQGLLDEGSVKFIINLKGTEFVNSSGLVVLVSALKNIGKAEGSLKLSNLSSYVKEVFEVTNMDKVFEIHESVEQALASFS